MFSPCCQSVAYDDYITEDGWGRCLECMEPVEYPIEQTHQEYWDCECEQNYIHSKYHKTSPLSARQKQVASKVRKFSSLQFLSSNCFVS